MQRNTFPMGNIQNYHEATAAEARNAVRGLDGVTTVPLYRQRINGDDGAGYREAENVFGVLNTSTDRITMPVSSRYTPLSHYDGFNPALDAIEHAGIDHEMMVSLENNRDEAGLYVLFPDLMFNEDREGGGMMYGLRFRNHYNKKMSFRGHVFCWRVQCLNGSTHAQLGEMVVSAMHVDSQIQSLRDQIDTFVTRMLSNASMIEQVVGNAIESPINFRDYDEVVRTLTATVTGSDRRSTAIAEAIPLETNRFQMFNAITAHASHAPKISWQTRDRLLDMAERNVLMAREVVPVPMPVAV